MSKAYQVFGYISTAALLGFFFYWLALNFQDQDLSLLKRPSTVIAIVIAAILSSFIIPISSIAWRRLLLALGCDRPVLLLMGIMGFSQLAKYVPGNIFQFAGRAVISIKQGIKAPVFLLSVGMETFLSVVACVVMVVILLIMSMGVAFEWLHLTEPMKNTFWVLVLFSAVVFVGLLLVPQKLVRNFLDVKGLSAQGVKVAILVALGLYVANYVLIGFGAWVVSLSMLEAGSLGYAEITIAFCVAWLVGFLAPGAPAGMGAREAMLLLLIQVNEGRQDALALVVALRLVTILGDLLCFFWGALLLKKWRE